MGCDQAFQYCLTDSVGPDFPDIETLDLYAHPITSEHAPLAAVGQHQDLDLAGISLFVEENFLWVTLQESSSASPNVSSQALQCVKWCSVQLQWMLGSMGNTAHPLQVLSTTKNIAPSVKIK
jgi:hypothetical protein